MSKHTPEPWITRLNEDTHTWAISDEGGDWTGLADVHTSGSDLTDPEGRANAARIVACVNALANLNPAAIKGAVEALDDISGICTPGETDANLAGEALALECRIIARAALALLKETSETPAPDSSTTETE